MPAEPVSFAPYEDLASALLHPPADVELRCFLERLGGALSLAYATEKPQRPSAQGESP